MSNDYPWSPGYTGPTGAGAGGRRGTPVPPRLTPPYEQQSRPRQPVAVPGSPPVTLPYSGAPAAPAPAGAGIRPAPSRESFNPFDPASPTGASYVGAGGVRAYSGGPAVTMPYSGAPGAPAPAGAGIVPVTLSAQDRLIRDVNRSLEGVNVPTTGYGGGGGGDEGGGGGGGAAGGGAPAGAASWQQLFDEQRAAAERARQRLDQEYSSRRDDLRSQYQFAETEQEKAQLAFLMAELESATERADQAIVAGYANAVQNIQQMGPRAAAAGNFETEAVQNLFLTAGERFGDTIADVQQQTGLGAGLAGTAFMPGEDFVNLLSADAAREAALTQRMGGIVSEELTDAERRMAFQQASQQADLQRQSASQGGQIRADQMAAVNARIAQDRRDFANNLRQLQSTYATIGAGYDMAGIESYGDQASLAQSEALFLSDLASRERIAAANNAARMAELERQFAREDEQAPEWQTPELAQGLLFWDTLPEYLQTQDMWNRLIGPNLPEGVTIPPTLDRGQSADAARAAGGAGAAGAQAPPSLVDIPDEQIQEEIERRAAENVAVEARAYYERTLQTLLEYESAGLIPRGTAQERATRSTQQRYPGVDF